MPETLNTSFNFDILSKNCIVMLRGDGCKAWIYEQSAYTQ